MTLNRKLVCILVAVVLFAVGLVLTLVDEGSARLIQGLLFGGLTSLSAAFL